MRHRARNSCDRILLLMLLAASTASLPAWAQETRFRVIDMVDLASVFAGEESSGGYLEFREEWIPDLQRPSLSKKVTRYVVVHPQDSLAGSQDSVKSSPGSQATPEERLRRFGERIRRLPVRDGKVQLTGIRYEFNLLDPHLEGSGSADFQVPDSMDRATRQLQQALIGLLSARTTGSDRYDWEQQMLSVEFSEQWSIDPATLEITKEVESVTPVIWQRRQTEEGEPLDEAGTGFPVYYKNRLRPVILRNP